VDAAVTGFSRSASSQEVFDEFCRLGARDFRSIGHKAIYVANSWRTLNCIGWHHAEPVLRSLAYALLNREGDDPIQGDPVADRPYRRNVGLVGQIRTGWVDGKPDEGATLEMLATLRQGSFTDASDKVIELLNREVAPQSIWDAMFAGAGELLASEPGIVGLHTLTTTNAMAYCFNATNVDETRRLIMLQNAAFLTMFRDRMPARGEVRNTQIDEWTPAPLDSQDKQAAVEEIFADIRDDGKRAAGKLLGFLAQHQDPKAIIDAARRLVFLKGDDSHDYKFSEAVLEDCYHVSPHWQNRFLAASSYWLRGSTEPDNSLVARTRAALGA
jgi:hypothetical protein